ncbi:tetratricopeptide repeat protein [Primorskyibacter aestuariivivens]|uniref:tetratricopeptide repeat protein n=1 Tax=Primorskyibacter aestuariivivens TaxID=1888912 RepID=UPI00230073D2|nr:tetratricopeptide repeat protein [Primorskyibacter aestuariivivens]MDA7427621.1 tetratricopeptide repeat protein [Primorskyibacter aestuariivivens]
MRLAISILMVAFLAACENTTFGDFAAFSDGKATVKDTANRNYYPDENLLVVAQAQFKEGNYGNAYRSYKKALDVVPTDPNAWLGFAASSDMLRRFDKSDYAYAKLKPIIGNRIEYLNNYGYSMLLRGELQVARTYFLKAYELDPSNEITANNLEMLRNSVKYPRRSQGDLRGI